MGSGPASGGGATKFLWLLALLIIPAGIWWSLPRKFEVAIVGAGISGVSTTLYTLEYFQRWGDGKTYPVFTIYEKESRIGGRISGVDVPGATRNPQQLGGNWFITANVNIMALLEATNVDPGARVVYHPSNGVAIPQVWDGEKLISQPVDEAHDPWVKEKKTLKGLTDGMVQDLSVLYLLTAYKELPWLSLQEWANNSPGMPGATPGVPSMVSETLRQGLEEAKLPQDFINNFVVPNVRFIWSQGANLNEFAGLLASQLNGEFPWVNMDINNGSMSLVNGIIKNVTQISKEQGVNLLDFKMETAVTEIESVGSDSKPRYKITSLDKNTGKSSSKEYDAVVIATPLEYSGVGKKKAQLKFKNIEFPEKTAQREWVPLDLYIVVADSINPAYFGSDEPFVADEILTTEESKLPFTTILAIDTINKTRNGVITDEVEKTIYVVFAFNALEKPLEMFRGVQDNKVFYHIHYDYTYCKLEPRYPDNLQPWLIAPNLINVNSIESMLSGMEVQLVSTSNAGKYLAWYNAHYDAKYRK